MTNEDFFSIDAPLNQEVRFDHGDLCRNAGETPDRRGRMFVKRTNRGWKWNCFNCGQSGFKKYSLLQQYQVGIRTFDEATAESLLNAIAENYELPTQRYNFKPLPPEAWAWFNKYEITENEVIANGIHWVDDFGGRIAIPISNEAEQLSGYQLRSLQETGPKYITQLFRRGSKNNRFRKLCAPYNMQDPISDNLCVVVEDALSAIKIHSIGVSSIALLGSPAKFPQELALELEDRFEDLIIWLDPDKTKLYLKYVNELTSLYDFRYVSFICGDKDPKAYERWQIKELIHAARLRPVTLPLCQEENTT